ncbi:MAG: PhoU domain-containing protein [Bacteroidota bacterium]|nr:PhoU domain-containing protein [Bacteroidota bacterium]
MEYIHKGLIHSGEIALEPAKKEIEVFSMRVLRMYDFLPTMFCSSDSKEKENLFERTSKYEEITDRMELEITSYISKASENEMSPTAIGNVEAMLKIVDNLESIGDSCYLISLSIKQKDEKKIEFSDHQNQNLLTMFDMVKEALNEMNHNLCSVYVDVNGSKATEIENNINFFRDKIRQEHNQSIIHGDYSYQTDILYTNFYSQLEKLADYVINITEAITKKKNT